MGSANERGRRLGRLFRHAWRRLLPFHRIPAEAGVLLPDLERVLVFCALLPLLHRLRAFPLLHSNTLRTCDGGPTPRTPRRGRRGGPIGGAGPTAGRWRAPCTCPASAE